MIDVALLLLRVWLGVVMVAHGYGHRRSIEGTAKWFASKGFARPRLNAMVSAGGEVLIGVLLILGAATPFAAAGLIAVMTVAFWSIHRFAGFFVFNRPDEGWEYVATLAVAALAVAVAGAGRYSLDGAWGIEGRLDGAAGAVIALAGVAAAVVHLGLLWRHPESD